MTRLLSFLHGWVAVIAGVVAAALVFMLLVVVWPSGDSKTATAYFSRTVHLYPGSDVVVLGVKIGSVSKVEPIGSQVRVTFDYSASQKVPADVHAVIIEPTIVADRVLQLAPAYGGGPVLADRATIPESHTGIPVELDEFNHNVTELAKALGPQGANSDGALSRLVEVGADNLGGNGDAANSTITNLSDMMGTLGDNRDELFATVRNLQSLVEALGAHDKETREFSDQLADVSHFLAAQRDDFGAALHTLGDTLDDVSRFIQENREDIAASVGSLTSVTKVLDEERYTLAHTLDAGAVGITNYPHMYTPDARTYNSRFVGNNVSDNPALFICQFFVSVGGPPKQCLEYLSLLKDVPLPEGSDPTLGGILPGASK
jgi:phospholipid/cholesterol/gamma-HCH transport system substrate-binding protein